MLSVSVTLSIWCDDEREEATEEEAYKMSEHKLDKLRRIHRSMLRWDDWWWWKIMRNSQECEEVRCAIRSWADTVGEMIKEMEENP